MTPPAAPVEFWFEFASTYSYLAAMRIEALARAAGAPLSWHPFLLGPIFGAQGWNDSPFNIYPAKGRYMWRDLERICAAQGIPFRKPTVFPRNGLLAARVACEFADTPWIAAFVRRVYTANFADDLEISDRAVVATLLADVGQEASPILERAESPPVKALLRAQTERAERLGIFGAPMLRVGEELFWGNDRLEDGLEWWRRSETAAPSP